MDDMTVSVRLSLFGFHVGVVDVDLVLPADGERVVGSVSRSVKRISRLWVKGMTA